MSAERTPRRTDPARRSAAPRTDAPASDDREITLRGMRFHALIGILEHERRISQPLEIDLTVRWTSREGVLDYRRLYDMVQQVVSSGPIDYLETVADQITQLTFVDPRVRQTRVAVRKPHVALPGPLAYAEVVVRCRRDDHKG